ncbi:DUF4124 domain-containing protein [Thioalkalivibrio paradoxus]|uniref:DUF4124 domain-containing protein n=1 Tax=Thioalkalivibrio paradoxus ARh 1 TaxID=713585 RepID=W0DTX4_9GAMM|nr:DUF4124 domain-containing protein [Thioalkalivibrio paradoxus]AHF00326.1 hypothetical protein THITH_17120 [Thioalkalivibrio paradoxus ARh 1]
MIRKGRLALPFGVLLALLGAPPGAAADVYRWTGPDGTPQFGDRPPSGSDSERIEVREPMGALPLPDAEEILRRPVRPLPEEPEHAAPVDADPGELEPATRDRHSIRDQ